MYVNLALQSALLQGDKSPFQQKSGKLKFNKSMSPDQNGPKRPKDRTKPQGHSVPTVQHLYDTIPLGPVKTSSPVSIPKRVTKMSSPVLIPRRDTEDMANMSGASESPGATPFAGARFNHPPSPESLPKPPTHWIQEDSVPTWGSSTYPEQAQPKLYDQISAQLKTLLKVEN